MTPNLTLVSEEAIKAAQAVLKGVATDPTEVRKDLTSASGAAAYDLQPVAMLLQPVITPLRNAIPRVKNVRGGTSSEWRQISKLLTTAFDPTVSSEGAQGNRLAYSFSPKSAPFAEMAVGDRVTFAATDAAMGFENDLKARAVTNTLFALMMVEELQILFGRVADLPAVTTPTLASASTGGSVAAGTYKVYARALTGAGGGTNMRGRKSAAATSSVLTGSTNVIKAQVPWVEGATQYEWYVDDGASGTATLQTTTGVNVALFTSLTTSGAALPSDNVANTLGIDGLFTQLNSSGSGSYADSGVQVKTLATDSTNYVGTDFVLSDIDAMNKAVWDNAKGDPEFIYMNATQRARATALVLAAGGAPTLFVQSDAEKAALTGGYLLSKYVNNATGRIQTIVTHPNLPDGVMMALSYRIPFPTGGDMVGVDIETSRDYQQIEYALTARRYDFEVFCREVVRMKFPGGAWIIRNIKSNVAGS